MYEQLRHKRIRLDFTQCSPPPDDLWSKPPTLPHSVELVLARLGKAALKSKAQHDLRAPRRAQSLQAAWHGLCGAFHVRPALTSPYTPGPAPGRAAGPPLMTALASRLTPHARSQAFTSQLSEDTSSNAPKASFSVSRTTEETGFIHISDSVVPSCHL